MAIFRRHSGSIHTRQGMDARGPLPEDRQKPNRRWVGSHWGALLFLGVVLVIVGSVLVPRLVYRYSPEGRLRSYAPEGIRGTCRREIREFLMGGTYVATEGYPSAVAGLFCDWRSPTGNLNNNIAITYLLFKDREALLDAYPGPHPTSCLTDEGGRRICYNPDYFGHPPRTYGCPDCYGGLTDIYHEHIVWTDGRIFLTDATIAGTFYR